MIFSKEALRFAFKLKFECQISIYFLNISLFSKALVTGERRRAFLMKSEG